MDDSIKAYEPTEEERADFKRRDDQRKALADRRHEVAMAILDSIQDALGRGVWTVQAERITALADAFNKVSPDIY